jgi:IPTL-CTERM motif
MDKVTSGSEFRSSVFNVFNSVVFKTVLIFSMFSVLIFIRPAENAYAIDGVDCQASPSPILNCGFESGGFSGWITRDLSDPFFPLLVAEAGISPGFGLFASDPPQGIYAALTGFDGNGPGTISLAQDVGLTSAATTLSFDYQCGWDLVSFGASVNRTFEVNIEPDGGGAPLQTDVILTALAGTTALPGTGGNQTATVDVSGFAGQRVRISFDWIVPEYFTGPAFCQIDNVFIDGGRLQSDVPTLSEWGMILAAGMLGILSLIALRRRQALRS